MEQEMEGACRRGAARMVCAWCMQSVCVRVCVPACVCVRVCMGGGEPLPVVARAPCCRLHSPGAPPSVPPPKKNIHWLCTLPPT